jgi:hypothetical protein
MSTQEDLDLLLQLGFTDADKNAQALTEAAGDFRAAVATLVKQKAEHSTTESEEPAERTFGLYKASWMKVVQPLAARHMGVENMGPMLYAFVRFTKPRRILEVGAGAAP